MSAVTNEEKQGDDAGAIALKAPAQDVQPERRSSLAERAAGAVIADVIASPESLPFDRVSRQRLLVAQAAADTLERLAETSAWDRLEPALAAHLIGQARRLSAYIGGLTQTRPVKASEPALLLLRRLERRLQIAAELVEDEEERKAQGTAGGLFLGDFTESETLPGDAPARPDGQAPKPGKDKDKKKKGDAGRAKGRGKWATKAERLAALRESRRVMAWIGIGVVAVLSSLVWRMVATVQERTLRQTPPRVVFQPMAYLTDLKIFIPATMTAQRDGDLAVIVSKEWLLRSQAQRVQDANGAAVFLMNRNVRRVRFAWEDGTPIVSYEQGVGTWVDPATFAGRRGGAAKAKPPQ